MCMVGEPFFGAQKEYPSKYLQSFRYVSNCNVNIQYNAIRVASEAEKTEK